MQTLVVAAEKGQRVAITKSNPGLVNIIILVYWDPATKPGEKFDLDVAALFLDANKKVGSAQDLLYYGTPNFAHPAGCAIHSGDSLDGMDTGPDETIAIRLDKVPAKDQRIRLVLSIFQAGTRGQTFGRVDNVKVEVLNADTKEKLIDFEITDQHADATALVLCDFYRVGNEWNFQGLSEELDPLMGKKFEDINDALALY